MPGENIQDWSTVAADNGNADSAINWAEGQPRASVNNSARAMMAALAKDRNLRNGSIVTSGSANAQIFTSGVSYTTVPTGLRCKLKIGTGLTNTSGVTLNMDGIGTVPVLDSHGSALGPSTLLAGGYFDFIYDGSNWIVNALSSIAQDYTSVALESAAHMALANGFPTDLHNITLSPGDWNVSQITYFETFGIGTSSSNLCRGSISTVSVTENLAAGAYSQAPVPANNVLSQAVPPYRISVAVPTIVYQVVVCTFSVGTAYAWGRISAWKNLA